MDAGFNPIVERGLELLRDRLQVPIVFVSEIRGDREILRAADLAPGELPIGPGASMPLADSYCGQMLSGEIPPLVCDVREHESLLTLPVTEAATLGAYVGAPIVLPGGEVYGALCCLAHEPRPDLREQHCALVGLVADLLADRIHHDRAERAAHAAQVETQAALALLGSLAERDPYTADHSEAVVGLAAATGAQLGLDAAGLGSLKTAAMLHDVGKIGVADATLTKAGPLDAADWASIREHPTIGGRLVRGLPSLAHLAPVIEAEHEHWDGTGYPNGLAGEAIPLGARIVLVCDAYDAMVSDRVYRPRRTPEAARAQLQAGAGTQFDPAVVQAFLQAVPLEA